MERTCTAVSMTMKRNGARTVATAGTTVTNFTPGDAEGRGPRQRRKSERTRARRTSKDRPEAAKHEKPESEDVDIGFLGPPTPPQKLSEILLEVVRKLQPDSVITAISGSTTKIKEAAIMCFPEKSRAALVSSLKTKTPDTEEIREARKLFTVSMRDMADAGRLDLKDVNSKFAQRNSPAEVAA